MKKTLLLFFVFLTINISAQINQNVTPYQICNNTNISQFGVFNLNSKISEILGNLDPAIHTVSFFLTPSDAINFSNPILNLSAFTNTIPGTQDLYVRVINTATNEISYTSFTLVISTAYAGNDGAVTVCETNFTAINLFSLITGEQSGGTWSWTSGTGGTFNAAAGIYIPSIGAVTSTFTYTIGTTSCSDSSVATINITAQPNAGTDGTITICDTSISTIDLFSLISGEQLGGTWLRVAGVGGIFDAISGTFTPTAGTTTSLFNYTMVGIAPCINDLSVVTITVNNCTPSIVCGGIFTDSGGSSANYSNNSNLTTIICPEVPGDSVSVTFTSFDTEVNTDALYVYNGNTLNPSMLIPSPNPAGSIPNSLPGGYWGNTLPGPFVSTSPDGCLTFVFRSDSTNTSEGWVANVNCGPLLCEAPTNITVSNVTNSSALLNWSSAFGDQWEIYVVPQGSPAPSSSSSGIIVSTNPFVLTGLSPDVCYTAYVRTLCAFPSEFSGPISFCMFNCENNAECAENLTLIAFLDDNNNGIKDPSEFNFNQGNFVYQVNDSGNNLFGTTNQGLYFIFDENPTNSYDISFAINSDLSPYYSSSVSHNNITLPTGSGANTLYFPIINTQPHLDASVFLIPNGQPRPGFTYFNTITIQNNGSQTNANGTLTFTKDSNVSIVFISQAGTTSTSNGFTYDFTNLAPFETRYITVSLLVPTIPTVSLGDLVTNSATVQINGDIDLSNNSSSITQTIVGSYDPNDKMESHGGKIVHSTFTATDYLYYTIQFENTGTASAEFVRIEDVLNNQLDENTFVMLTASHNVNTKREGNELTWHFYTINLPPTITNPAASHGFVSFKIKPKPGYAIGDIIPNTAAIFFDYNPAIITNTFTTEFVQALVNPTFEANSISLYPNPSNNNITIHNNNSVEKITKIAIYDISGKMIYSLNNSDSSSISIDVSYFSKGMYFVELVTDNNAKIIKKLLIK